MAKIGRGSVSKHKSGIAQNRGLCPRRRTRLRCLVESHFAGHRASLFEGAAASRLGKAVRADRGPGQHVVRAALAESYPLETSRAGLPRGSDALNLGKRAGDHIWRTYMPWSRTPSHSGRHSLALFDARATLLGRTFHMPPNPPCARPSDPSRIPGSCAALIRRPHPATPIQNIRSIAHSTASTPTPANSCLRATNAPSRAAFRRNPSASRSRNGIACPKYDHDRYSRQLACHPSV